MSWHREWQAIKEAINEFAIICNDYVAALSVRREESYGTVEKIILPMTIDIVNRITALGERYRAQLPLSAFERLNDFTINDMPFIVGFSAAGSASAKLPSTVAHIGSLIRRFKADFDYLTSDLEGTVVRQTARGFIHLQRSIIADECIRAKWVSAYNKNEEACEKLGAVHLLQHGIWSFKAHSIGERTDLILGEPLRDKNLAEVYLVAEGLVLTEWKIASTNNHKTKFEEALAQAELYSKGSLAPIELKGYRYLVVVTEKQIATPEDSEVDGVIYKYINIAVNPASPSKAARNKQSA